MTAAGRKGDIPADNPGAEGAATPSPPPRPSELRVVLRELVASMCGVPVGELDDTRPLPEYGLTSRDAVDLSGRLEELLNTSLPPTLLWENPTVQALLDHLAPGHTPGQDRHTAAGDEAPRSGADAVPIAVVGIGCRLPGKINGPEAFWQQLLAGADAVGRVPGHRWRDFDNGSAETAAVLDRTCRWGGFLDDVEGFDADFFGITPREAEVMDPQQRLLLEVGCEALDHAGIGARSLQGSATGVFVGLSALEYGHLTNADVCRVTAWTSTGAAGSIVANRMSYLLDLRGPSMTIDSACSSSLVAVHQACRSLRSAECDTALAAGVNVVLSPATTATFDQAGALAADGRCKPFDAGADGITRGEGCGVVVLRTLPDAQRDGDRILAVIRGSAVNSDGRSAGLMAPNPHAQRALLRSALRDARAQALDVDYVEAHGTGTLLGDPIEADALGDVLGQGRTADRPLLIGSVKSNLGHLEGAAGIVGLIKTVLSLHHGRLPATLHFRRPNPHIDFTALGLRVVTETTPWPHRPHTPALAGVSAFGFGGTNAHVVLEQAPPSATTAHAQSTTAHPDAADGTAPHVLLVTARSKDRLRDAATSLAHRLASKDAPALTDLAHTLARLDRGPVSAAVVGRTTGDLVGALAALVREEAVPAVIEAATRAGRPGSRRAVFVFSGYGSQWSGMGRRLLQEDPAFAASVTRMDPAFTAELGISLTDLIMQEQSTRVDRAQPLLFGVQVALADTVRAHGVTPAAVIGHSMGEVSAAVVCGALTLPDGLRVMHHRSLQLTGIDEEHAGAMAAVELREEERTAVLRRYPGVDIAVHASPQRCTVAGPSQPVRRLTDDLTQQGRLARLLAVGGAGHSRAVDPVLPALREALAPLQPHTPAIAWYSTVLDDPRTPVRPGADYWCANARRPVRLQQAVTAAAADGHDLFLEIAPHPVAAVPLAETLAAASRDDALVVPTLHKNGDDTVHLFTALARLHLAGVAGIGPALWLFAAAVDMRRSDLTAVRIDDLVVHRWLPLSASTPVTTVWQPSGPHQAAVTLHSRSAAGTWLCHASARVVSAPQRPEDDRPRDADTGAALHWQAATDEQPAPGRPPLAHLLDVLLHAPAGLEAPGAERDPDRAAPAGERAAVSLRSLLLQRTAVDDEYHIRCEPSADGHGPADDEHERRPQDDRWDIRAASVSGRADIVAHGLQMRPVQQSDVPAPLDHITYDIQWTKAGAGVPHPPHSLLLLTDPRDPGRHQLTAPLAAALDGKGTSVTTGEYHPDSIAALLDDWRQRAAADRTAVALLFTSPPPASEAPSHAVEAAAHVARLLLSAPSQTPVPRLWLVTRNAVCAAPGEVPHPDQACLRGFVRALALERPELRACLVDIAAQPAPEDDLVPELLADGDADEVAWRAGTRLVARLSPADLSEPYDHVPFARRDGAYILTGGLTGLGLATARRLAENGAGRIVLNGRRAPGPQAAQTLRELADLGTSVSVVQGDIAEPGVAHRLVEAAEAEGQVLRGVAHAAGVLHDRVVTDLQSRDIAEVFRPKAIGALHLEAATDDHDLDWWLSYSSAAALLGSPGQAAYAAANAWLDAMATRRRAAGRPATAIAWGPWAQVGGAPADNPALPLEPIALSEGLDALQALVTCVRPYTGVVHLDGGRALHAFPGLQSLPFFAGVLADGSGLGEDWIGPDGIARLGDAAARMVLDRLARRTAAVMGFPAHELDDDVALTDLGLDSLMTVRIQNAARHDFAVDVPPTLLLRGASLRDLGAAVLGELGLQAADPAPPAEGPPAQGPPATPAPPRPAPPHTHPPLPTTIGPRDAAERLVASVWDHVLGSRPGSVHDDFVTTCGGPHAVRALTDGIRRRLGDTGIALTEEQVLGNPTVAAIAELIRPAVNGTGDRIVRTLRPAPQGGGRPPLFTFHPAGGPTSVYRPLVELLPADQPVYGFERIEDAASLEEKAARYLDIVKDLQPEGPYRLLGWSFGGCLAYEAACRLRDQGQDVSFLGLIDTILPAALPGLDSTMLLERFGRFVQYIEQTYGHRLELPYEELAGTPDEEQIDVVLRLVADAGLSMSHGILEHQRTSYIDARVGERYRPRPYEGHVVLYRAQEAQPLTTALDPRYLRSEADLGWAPLCPSLEIVPVQGDHLSLIDPPFVDVIAEHLTHALGETGG
ncbi:SDR family NAD(P)-dependent oxidoreductase [Streptomyces antibioticus]|uniref:SDR family NAD(P)-dependent oxidoreductase n=1 Tax=Streptomyces antibioticus TaxID=1890 RepID=UPI0033C9EA18